MTKSKKRKIKKQGACVFCSGSNLTKQHVVPNWISSCLPSSPYVQNITNTSLGFVVGQKEVFLGAGDVFDKTHNAQFGQVKVRNVCLSCNGGWMSQLEQKSIPVIKKMMFGQDFIFTKSEAKIAASAIALITMMNEFTDPDRSRRAIPASHRRFLMNSLSLPSNWYVGVGLMKETGESKSIQHHFIDNNPARYVDAHVAAQIHTVRLGRLVFQSVMCEGFSYPVKFKEGHMLQIWPYVETGESWLAGMNGFDEEEFLKFANELYHRMLSSYALKYSPSA